MQVFRINKTLKTHGRYLLEINEIKKLNKNLSNRKTNSYTIVRNGIAKRDGKWTHYDENEEIILKSIWSKGDSTGLE